MNTVQLFPLYLYHLNTRLEKRQLQMGIAERKERERIELRTRILDTAEALFLEEGFEKASMRNIAKLIEYSPATLYNHFQTKDEIFFELHSKYFDLLYSKMVPLREIEHPVERLRQLGRVYLRFALDHPKYYNLMFMHAAPLKSMEEGKEWDLSMNTFGFLQETVEACIVQGYIEPQPMAPLLMMIWGAMHGVISLQICCRLTMFPEEHQEQLMAQVGDLVVSILAPKTV